MVLWASLEHTDPRANQVSQVSRACLSLENLGGMVPQVETAFLVRRAMLVCLVPLVYLATPLMEFVDPLVFLEREEKRGSLDAPAEMVCLGYLA